MRDFEFMHPLQVSILSEVRFQSIVCTSALTNVGEFISDVLDNPTARPVVDRLLWAATFGSSSRAKKTETFSTILQVSLLVTAA